MADSTTGTPDVVDEVKTKDTKTVKTEDPTDAPVSTSTETNGKSVEPHTDLEANIIRQVEYYFGDINLGRDRFMQEQLKTDKGWIPLETMIKFKRLKELTEDFSVIVAALRKSQSGLVVIHEDELKIQRNPDKPIPVFNHGRKEDLKSRSLYVKGFPVTETIDDLLKFFDSHGPPEYVQMRRDEDRAFKGSCFVIFKTVDDASKFLNAEKIKYGDGDNELSCLFKDAYYKQKRDEKKTEALEESKKREENKQKEMEENLKTHMEQMVKGAILHLTGLSEGSTRENIKESFKDYEAQWVDFEIGDTEAYVRFVKENDAEKAYKSAMVDDKLLINDSEVLGSVLDGDAETKHWENVFKQKLAAFNKKGSQRKRSGYRGRSDRGPSKKKSRKY